MPPAKAPAAPVDPALATAPAAAPPALTTPPTLAPAAPVVTAPVVPPAPVGLLPPSPVALAPVLAPVIAPVLAPVLAPVVVPLAPTPLTAAEIQANADAAVEATLNPPLRLPGEVRELRVYNSVSGIRYGRPFEAGQPLEAFWAPENANLDARTLGSPVNVLHMAKDMVMVLLSTNGTGLLEYMCAYAALICIGPGRFTLLQELQIVPERVPYGGLFYPISPGQGIVGSLVQDHFVVAASDTLLDQLSYMPGSQNRRVVPWSTLASRQAATVAAQEAVDKAALEKAASKEASNILEFKQSTEKTRRANILKSLASPFNASALGGELLGVTEVTDSLVRDVINGVTNNPECVLLLKRQATTKPWIIEALLTQNIGPESNGKSLIDFLDFCNDRVMPKKCDDFVATWKYIGNLLDRCFWPDGAHVVHYPVLADWFDRLSSLCSEPDTSLEFLATQSTNLLVALACLRSKESFLKATPAEQLAQVKAACVVKLTRNDVNNADLKALKEKDRSRPGGGAAGGGGRGNPSPNKKARGAGSPPPVPKGNPAPKPAACFVECRFAAKVLQSTACQRGSSCKFSHGPYKHIKKAEALAQFQTLANAIPATAVAVMALVTVYVNKNFG